MMTWLLHSLGVAGMLVVLWFVRTPSPSSIDRRIEHRPLSTVPPTTPCLDVAKSGHTSRNTVMAMALHDLEHGFVPTIQRRVPQAIETCTNSPTHHRPRFALGRDAHRRIVVLVTPRGDRGAGCTILRSSRRSACPLETDQPSQTLRRAHLNRDCNLKSEYLSDVLKRRRSPNIQQKMAEGASTPPGA